MNLTLDNMLPVFPVGTSLDIYKGAIIDGGAARPVGLLVTGAGTVSEAGTAALTGLPEGYEELVAAAKLGGVWQIRRIQISAQSAEPATKREVSAKADLIEVENRTSAALEEFRAGVGQGNATADTGAFEEALTELASSGSSPFARRLILGDATYRINAPLVAKAPIVVEGKTSYGSRLLIDDAFPAGGKLLTFTSTGAAEGLLREESHVPGWGLRHLCIDGNGRSVEAHAFRFQKVDRGQFQDVLVRNLNGSVITGSSFRESQWWAFRTWLCGNATSPVLNLWDDGTGGLDGHNLLSFTACQMMLSCGDHLLAGTDAPEGQIVRGIFFNSCVFHGLLEYFDSYSDNYGHNGNHLVPLPEGSQQCRHVIKNARSIVYDGGCRFNLPGRGLPIFSLQESALGASTINTVAIEPSVLTIRPGYTGRSAVEVSAASDQIVLTNSEGGHGKTQLQTGSRVQLAGASLPAPLVAATDYYAITVDEEHFKVATSRANAIAGTAIDLTTAGSGTITVTQQDTVFTAVAATDICTAAGHRLPTGARIRVTTDNTLPGGLAAETDYFVIRLTKDTFKLATTRKKAEAGEAIDLTTAGTGNSWLSLVHFLAEISVGTLGIGDPQLVENLPARAYVKVDGAGVLNWPNAGASTSLTLPVAEIEGGAVFDTKVRGGLEMRDNNVALWGYRTNGAGVQMVRLTSANVVAVGVVSGEGTAQFTSPTDVQLLVNGTKRFEANGTGIGFFAKTPAARPNVKPAAEVTAKEICEALETLGLIE